MDILAGMFAYLAGIGAVIAALAISFSVLVSQPNQAVQPQNQAQSATAMVVKPIQPNKAVPVEAPPPPRRGCGGWFRRSAHVAGPFNKIQDKTQVSRAAFSATPTERFRVRAEPQA
jgi:hypothetical protein